MPTSVRLDAETERAVERLARAKGTTKSRVIREAILAEAAREKKNDKAGSVYEKIAHLIGSVRGGPPDLSERTGEKVRKILLERERKRR